MSVARVPFQKAHSNRWLFRDPRKVNLHEKDPHFFVRGMQLSQMCAAPRTQRTHPHSRRDAFGVSAHRNAAGSRPALSDDSGSDASGCPAGLTTMTCGKI